MRRENGKMERKLTILTGFSKRYLAIKEIRQVSIAAHFAAISSIRQHYIVIKITDVSKIPLTIGYYCGYRDGFELLDRTLLTNQESCF
jgi:hypothetical protein